MSLEARELIGVLFSGRLEPVVASALFGHRERCHLRPSPLAVHHCALVAEQPRGAPLTIQYLYPPRYDSPSVHSSVVVCAEPESARLSAVSH
ncbi:unnamed protein product [Heligmosomoides polygyrus]|uniref:DUF5753 domain-containing protein n=1 Tax=Heligmosomoides polygyrus TaxID=6339 RepID=A0A183GL77_HELPZ|nr:unnamed protein product [Heligmosomoides polygyrus]